MCFIVEHYGAGGDVTHRDLQDADDNLQSRTSADTAGQPTSLVRSLLGALSKMKV